MAHKLKWFALAALAVLLPFVSGAAWAVQETIKIGLLAPITGPTPSWGKKQVIGMEMALDEINKRGGIYGKPVEVIVYDTGSDAKKTLDLYKRLVEEDKVLVVIGPLYSDPCQALIPKTNEGKVAIIATASAKPGLSDLKKWPYGFRMTVSSEKKEVYLAKAWVESNNIQSVVVVYDKKAAVTRTLGSRLWPGILEKLGVAVLNKEDPITFETGERNYSHVVAQIKAFQPDGLCISALPREAGHLVAEIRRAGLKQPILGGSPCLSPVLIDIAGTAAEGIWAVSLFNKDDPSPKVRSYVEAFSKRCKERYPDMTCDPEQFDVAVYDILSFVADIMKRKHVTGNPEDLQAERDKIRDGLASMKRWRGTAGMMAFDKKGDGIRTIHILRVQDGKWQPVR